MGCMCMDCKHNDIVTDIEADSLEECKEAIDDEDFALCDERIIDIKQISEAEYTHILYQGFMD